MANDVALWKEIAEKYQLKEHDLSRLATPWHTDLDLGRPIEVMTEMSKSRKLGFTVFQDTEQTFYDLFDQLRAAGFFPACVYGNSRMRFADVFEFLGILCIVMASWSLGASVSRRQRMEDRRYRSSMWQKRNKRLRLALAGTLDQNIVAVQ